MRGAPIVNPSTRGGGPVAASTIAFPSRPSARKLFVKSTGAGGPFIRHSPDSGADEGHGPAFGPPAQQMSPRTDAVASESRGLPALPHLFATTMSGRVRFRGSPPENSQTLNTFETAMMDKKSAIATRDELIRNPGVRRPPAPSARSPPGASRGSPLGCRSAPRTGNDRSPVMSALVRAAASLSDESRCMTGYVSGLVPRFKQPHACPLELRGEAWSLGSGC